MGLFSVLLENVIFYYGGKHMFLINYFSSLNPLAFTNALPGNIAQGLIWGIMALGVYITFRLLDFADLTVDGSFATGGAVTVMMTVKAITSGLLCSVPALQDFSQDCARVFYIPNSEFHRSLPVF